MGNVCTSLRRSIVLGLVAVLALGSFSTLALAAPKNQQTSPLAVPVTGTATGGTFQGIANITSFAVNSANQLVANGTLTGVVTDATGAVTQSLATTFSTPVTTSPLAAPSCSILALQLGPIHLDLLGRESSQRRPQSTGHRGSVEPDSRRALR